MTCLPNKLVVNFAGSPIPLLRGRDIEFSIRAIYVKGANGSRVCDRIEGSAKGVCPTRGRLNVTLLFSPHPTFQNDYLNMQIIEQWIRHTVELKLHDEPSPAGESR